MFNQQTRELAELMGTDKQLKELYDDLEREDKQKEEELTSLRDQNQMMSILMDSYGIPRRKDNKTLSLLERLDIVLRKTA